MRKLASIISLLCFYTKAHAINVPVYADTNGKDSVQQAITFLFRELDKAGFGQYTVYPGKRYSGSGILLTLAADNINHDLSAPLKGAGPEGIAIQSTATGVRIIANTNLGLQEAVYIYLEQLGFRFLAPGDHWTVIPVLKNLFRPFQLNTAPSYEFRNISIGYGFNNDPKASALFYDWARANRMGGAFPVNLGHVYDLIVLSDKSKFQEHPEWYVGNVKKGETPPNPKFNVAEKGVVKFVEEYIVRKAENNARIGYPNIMLSMDPSDGGGFCETKECLKIGGPSEQTFYLANAAAKKLRSKYPNLWVGVGAYSQYIEPPRFAIEPNIFVMLTTAFNPSKYSTDQLIDLWAAKAKKIGIYEFLSFYDWDFDVPGRNNVSNTDYLTSSIRNWYRRGVRSYEGESTSGYVTRALGHYISLRLLWNVNVNVDSVRNDFLKNAFGNAAPIMQQLHKQWEKYAYAVPADNDIATWLNMVNEADKIASTSAIRRRLIDYKAYLHYLALYAEVKKNNRSEELVQLMNYAWRSIERPAFSALPVLATLPAYVGFREMRIWTNEVQPWKYGEPISDSEIESLFRKDLQQYQLQSAVPVFSVPRTFTLIPTAAKTGKINYDVSQHTFINKTTFIIQITAISANNKLIFESGYSSTPTGTERITIVPFGTGKPVLSYTQSERNKTDSFSLSSLSKGIYEVTVDDPNKSFKLDFKGEINSSILASAGTPITTSTVWGYNIFYFNVPDGSKMLQLFKQGAMRIQTPTGRILDYTKSTSEVLNIAIQNGETGIWKITDQHGSFSIAGIPAYVGNDPGKMLIPVY